MTAKLQWRRRLFSQRRRSLLALSFNWLFAGSLRAGQRAAAVMSLIQSGKLNGHDPYPYPYPYPYRKDVLARLPTHKYSQIDELLPPRWQPKNP